MKPVRFHNYELRIFRATIGGGSIFGQQINEYSMLDCLAKKQYSMLDFLAKKQHSMLDCLAEQSSIEYSSMCSGDDRG